MSSEVDFEVNSATSLLTSQNWESLAEWYIAAWPETPRQPFRTVVSICRLAIAFEWFSVVPSELRTRSAQSGDIARLLTEGCVVPIQEMEDLAIELTKNGRSIAIATELGARLARAGINVHPSSKTTLSLIPAVLVPLLIVAIPTVAIALVARSIPVDRDYSFSMLTNQVTLEFAKREQIFMPPSPWLRMEFVGELVLPAGAFLWSYPWPKDDGIPLMMNSGCDIDPPTNAKRSTNAILLRSGGGDKLTTILVISAGLAAVTLKPVEDQTLLKIKVGDVDAPLRTLFRASISMPEQRAQGELNLGTISQIKLDDSIDLPTDLRDLGRSVCVKVSGASAAHFDARTFHLSSVWSRIGPSSTLTLNDLPGGAVSNLRDIRTQEFSRSTDAPYSSILTAAILATGSDKDEGISVDKGGELSFPNKLDGSLTTLQVFSNSDKSAVALAGSFRTKRFIAGPSHIEYSRTAFDSLIENPLLKWMWAAIVGIIALLATIVKIRT